MSTVSKEIADLVIENQGCYPAVEACDEDEFYHTVIQYQNSYFGHVCYAILDDRQTVSDYAAAHSAIKILWSSE